MYMSPLCSRTPEDRARQGGQRLFATCGRLLSSYLSQRQRTTISALEDRSVPWSVPWNLPPLRYHIFFLRGPEDFASLRDPFFSLSASPGLRATLQRLRGSSDNHDTSLLSLSLRDGLHSPARRQGATQARRPQSYWL